MNVTFQSDNVMAVESPVKLVEGESVTFTCTYWGTPTSVSAKVYLNNSDKTSTVMPSGSVSISGNVATLKPATAMVGGNRYVFAVTGTVASETRIRKFVAIVAKDEAE